MLLIKPIERQRFIRYIIVYSLYIFTTMVPRAHESTIRQVYIYGNEAAYMFFAKRLFLDCFFAPAMTTSACNFVC